MKTETFPSLPLLLVDDEEPWLHSLSFTLEYSAGINNVVTCSDGRKVPSLLRERAFSLILLDLNMPLIPGEELLPQIRLEKPETPVIVVSGMNQVEAAVRCLKAGAFDYYVKTTEPERLVAGIRNALSLRNLRNEIRDLKDKFLKTALLNPGVFSNIVTCNRKMIDLFRYLEAIAPGREPVLITGESGVGKELFARAVHRLSRPEGPWVAVNAAGLDDQVFADTLFGHVKGAFTGAEKARQGMIERAAGGTLFLDEIGDLSHASQVKLLRLLQEGEYFPVGSDTPRRMSARVVCATNHDLPAKQQKGDFRRDLFYRLETHHLHVPPLRERPEDIPLLFDHFLEKAAAEFGRSKIRNPPEVLDLLSTYSFPGNVREMRAMVYNATGAHTSSDLSPSFFRQTIDRKRLPQGATSSAGDESGITFGLRLPTLDRADQLLVDEALRRSRGNQTVAARLLGISQPALSKRLKKRATQPSDR